MTQAAQALFAFQTKDRTRSVVYFVRKFGGDVTPDVQYDVGRFYHFPDGSWIATKGTGRSHQVWINQGLGGRLASQA